MTANSVAARSLGYLTQRSNLPPSFDGNPFLYASALTSVMCIACLGLAVAGWMVRDICRERYRTHPTSLLFMFRLMMMLVGFASFVRAMPEVLYLQVYGDPDVSLGVQTAILTGKRIADSLALYFVLAWMLIFVAIYPPLSLALQSGTAKYVVVVDAYSTWPRLGRPLATFCIIVGVSMAFAYAKVYGV
jgi:hypothetical protein